jgi:hypothetical protein
MMSGMTVKSETTESQANLLCKACGLCCTGHLFTWTKLRAAEMDSIEALGVRVVRSIPSQRGFNQPCPLWKGQCTIYETEQYPRFCRTYKCKLLKELLEESTSLPHALTLIEQAKEAIRDLEALLPPSENPNFRERLVAELEVSEDPNFRQKVKDLLMMYENVFGVRDVIE